jgi:hypothetical protein
MVMDPLLVHLDDIAQGLFAILSHGGGLLCRWLDLDNPTSPHELPPSQKVRKKRYVINQTSSRCNPAVAKRAFTNWRARRHL